MRCASRALASPLYQASCQGWQRVGGSRSGSPGKRSAVSQGGGATVREASKARWLSLWEEPLRRSAPKLVSENRRAPHPYWDTVHKQDTAMGLPGGLLRRGPGRKLGVSGSCPHCGSTRWL